MPGPAYLDLDVLFMRSGDGYQAQVVRSPAGEGQSVTFPRPFSDLELENLILRLGRFAGRTRRIEDPQVVAAKAAGGRLFDAVFTGKVGECLSRSIDRAQEEQSTLRIRLRLSDCRELADLPWELLYNRADNEFLALSGGTPVIRHVQLPTRARAVHVDLPLRILLIRSEPSDYPELDLDAEWAQVAEALAELSDAGLLAFTELEKPTLRELRRELLRDTYHVLHYMGHGGFDAERGGTLMFADQAGRGAPVSGEDLAVILRDHTSLRLAILNACQAGRSDPEDPFAGVADSLVRRGIPAVVAMQFEITDTAAVEFAPALYGALAAGRPVDTAVAEARKAIFTVSRLEWATPVLYLRGDDVHLFDIPQAKTASGTSGARRAVHVDPRPDGPAPTPLKGGGSAASVHPSAGSALTDQVEKKLLTAAKEDQRWLRSFIEDQVRVRNAEVIAGPDHLKYLRLVLHGGGRTGTYCYVTTRGYLDFRLPKSSARNRRYAVARDVKDDGTPFAVRLRLNSSEAFSEALELATEAAGDGKKSVPKTEQTGSTGGVGRKPDSAQKSGFGRSQEEWAALTQVGWSLLLDRARNGQLTTYTELNDVLAEQTGQPRWDFSTDLGRAAVGELLGRLADRSFAECGLMISAICKFVHENDAGLGFYAKAADLGLIPAHMSRQAKWEFWTMHVGQVQEWAMSRKPEIRE